jgi:DNA-binding helix-hairpin-helix protein with protein kinase domain
VTHALSTVYDLNHQPQVLGEKLAQGGEGEIYPLLDRPEVLLKRYHPALLAKRGPALQAKVEAMRSLTALRQNRQLADSTLTRTPIPRTSGQ